MIKTQIVKLVQVVNATIEIHSFSEDYTTAILSIVGTTQVGCIHTWIAISDIPEICKMLVEFKEEVERDKKDKLDKD